MEVSAQGSYAARNGVRLQKQSFHRFVPVSYSFLFFTALKWENETKCCLH